jgi:triosephosphate isomerase (TIM)
MNCTVAETEALISDIELGARDLSVEAELLVIPPFTSLFSASAQIANLRAPLALGAQDIHWENSGAFTGEVSGRMLRDVGCSHVLVGHSERRTLFGERGDVLLKKLCAALRDGLVPILCIGENLDEREAGRTEEVLGAQLAETLFRLDPAEHATIVIAYEPVWAIGTGRNATVEQVEEAHRFIRGRISAAADSHMGRTVRVLYGGSVNSKNAAALLHTPGVDGALVGGASLKAEEFLSIAAAAGDSGAGA